MNFTLHPESLSLQIDHCLAEQLVTRQIALPCGHADLAGLRQRSEGCPNVETDVRIFARLQISEREVIDRRTGVMRHGDPAVVRLIEHDQLRRKLDIRKNVQNVVHAAVAEVDIDVSVTAFRESLRGIVNEELPRMRKRLEDLFRRLLGVV